MTRVRTRRWTGVGTTLLAAGTLLAACTGSSNSAVRAGRAGRTLPPSVASSTTVSGSLAPKPALTGLIDMGVQTAYQTGRPFAVTDPSTLDVYAGAFSGIVVNEAWSQLEPAAGVEQWGPLERSLAAVAAWNAAHPATPLGVKLRVFAGRSAPGWVTAQSGTVTIVVHKRHVTVGKWWTQPFESAWHAFQQDLAARYDANSLVRQVSVSSCSSSTGEPFVVSGAPASQANLTMAGWTPQAQEQCLAGALSDYSGWKRTPITFAFNPLPTPSGPDSTFMVQEMRACAASASEGGPFCIVGNNDLSDAASMNRYSAPALAEISQLRAGPQPPVVYFQTVGAKVTCQAMAVATMYHASSVELWPPNGAYLGFSAVPVNTLASWNTALASGAPITC
jgi:hypothetical protein